MGRRTSAGHHKLIYGMKEGVLRHISEVEKGLACGCICPYCKEELIAKKGEKMMHHFAHRGGTECEYGYESTLHQLAKEILSQAKRIVLPPVYLNNCRTEKEPDCFFSPGRLIEASPAVEVTVERVELEKHFTDVVPDVVVYARDASGREKSFFVEVYVTHKVDEDKLIKLREHQISTIEIDLSRHKQAITREELQEILLLDHPEKTWVYNQYAEKIKKKFLRACKILTVQVHGCAVHAMNCPLRQRCWHGKAYANVIDDCSCCEYFMGETIAEDRYTTSGILCTGEEHIAEVEDLALSKEQRIQKEQRVQKELIDLHSCKIPIPACPICGGILEVALGPYGPYARCTNYPDCRFTCGVTRSR